VARKTNHIYRGGWIPPSPPGGGGFHLPRQVWAWCPAALLVAPQYGLGFLLVLLLRLRYLGGSVAPLPSGSGLSGSFSCTSVWAWFLACIVVETTVRGSLLGAGWLLLELRYKSSPGACQGSSLSARGRLPLGAAAGTWVALPLCPQAPAYRALLVSCTSVWAWFLARIVVETTVRLPFGGQLAPTGAAVQKLPWSLPRIFLVGTRAAPFGGCCWYMGGFAALPSGSGLSGAFSCTSVWAWFLARIVVETTVLGRLCRASTLRLRPIGLF
jgi:hypothetical protein